MRVRWMPQRADLARWWWRLVRPPWRDPLNAVFLFAVGTAYFFSGLHTATSTGRPTPSLWQSMLMLAVICGADLFRARAPRAALRAGLAVFAVSLWTGGSLPYVLVLCDLLYASVLYGSRRSSRILPVLVAAVGLIAAVAGVVAADDWRAAVVVVVGFVTIPLVPVLWALQVRFHRELAGAERARAEQMARLAELDRWAAVSAERGRMARDLHDVVAGHLSAIAIQSEAVLSMAGRPATDPAWAGRGAAAEALHSVRENSVQALNEMRAMIGLLRGDEPEPRHAPPRLRELAPAIESARAAGLTVDLVHDLEDLPELPPAVDLTAYRIVQEALTNAAKHAPGATVSLSVGHQDEMVSVEVRNTLTKEVPEDHAGGLGLAGMAERARILGGTLAAGPHLDGERWQVGARLPLAAASLAEAAPAGSFRSEEHRPAQAGGEPEMRPPSRTNQP